MGRVHNNRDLFQSRVFFDLLKTLIAVNLGHVDVQENVRRKFDITIEDLQGFICAFSYQTDNGRINFSEGVAENLYIFFVIIDIENRHKAKSWGSSKFLKKFH